MLKACIKYITLIFIMLIFKYFYTDYIPSIFIIIAIFLPIISVVYVFIGIFSIKASINCIPNVIIRNKLSKINLAVSNISFLPFFLIKIKYDIPEKIQDKKNNNIINISIPARKKYNYEIDLCCKHKGLYEIKLIYIQITDLFGFINIKHRYKNSLKISVIPRKINILYNKDNLSDEMDYSKFLFPIISEINSLNQGNIAGTRKYIVGDDLKSIHWKHSAKLDEIIVKEFEQEQENFILIAMDLKNYNIIPQDKEDFSLDGIIETCIAFTLKLVSENIPCDIIWYNNYSKHNSIYKLINISDFNDFFNIMIETESYIEDIFIYDIVNHHLNYNENYNQAFIITVYIDNDLTSKLCTTALSRNIQINVIYFEIVSNKDLQNNINLMKHYNIKIWHIKQGNIADAFY